MSRVEVDGVRIAYEETGAGDDLVLVHDHGESGLAPTYDLTSMAGDVGAVIAETGARDPLSLGDFKASLAAIEPLLRGGHRFVARVAAFDGR